MLVTQLAYSFNHAVRCLQVLMLGYSNATSQHILLMSSICYTSQSRFAQIKVWQLHHRFCYLEQIENLENEYAGAESGLTSPLSSQGNVIYCGVGSVNAGALSRVQKSLRLMEVAKHY